MLTLWPTKFRASHWSHLKGALDIRLGNTLRRVLISSMPGSAVVAVKCEQVTHEYCSLPGVKEDVVDILLNLKNVAINLHDRSEVILRLRKTGPRNPNRW